MMRGKKSLGIAFAGLLALAVSAGLAWASHVVLSEPRLAAVPIIDRWPPLAPAMVRAEEIKAQHVQAHTIYANKIEADDIQGVIYQSQSPRMKTDRKGELKAPEVSAAVIYADTIKANSVVADTIYVRDLPRR
ncbi:MAG TPA: hypothetical protein VFO18_11660 [Methylomirabilota bacterium]|nr:hypothetical protein [Methylomirabilota bacterium]